MSSDQGSVNQGKIGVRYSRALLSSLLSSFASALTKADGELLLLRAECLLSIASALKSNKEAIFTLQNPMIDTEQKRELLIRHVENTFNVTGVTDATIRQQILSFIQVVFNNGRIAAIYEIVKNFKEEVQNVLGVIPVRVYVARELPQSEKDFIVEKLSVQVSSNQNWAASRSEGMSAIECEWIIDPSLLGGFVVEFAGRGDLAGKRIDASLQGRLSSIGSSLLL